LSIPWFKNYKLKENPLFQSPLKRNDTLRNYSNEKDNFLYLVNSGSILLFLGGKASGKTTILKYLIDNFKGKSKLIYIDLLSHSKKINLLEIIKKRQSLFDRIFNKKPENIILLLDNCQDLTKRQFEQLHYYYDKKILHSVVLTADLFSNLKIPKSLMDRIGKRIFETQVLDREEAVEMIKEKVPEKINLKDYQYELLYILSDKNNRRFIHYTDAVFQYISENPETILSSRIINKIVKHTPIVDDIVDNIHEICSVCGSTLVEISGKYRCLECDSFCYSCGIIINDDDSMCPYCGKVFEEG
jgi:predicted AAA+ superfamily ATPase